jgi:hypothetical protein
MFPEVPSSKQYLKTRIYFYAFIKRCLLPSNGYEATKLWLPRLAEVQRLFCLQRNRESMENAKELGFWRTSSGEFINVCFIHWNHDANHLLCPGSHLWWIGQVLNQTLQIDTKIFLRQNFYSSLVTSSIRHVKGRQNVTQPNGVTYSLLNAFLWPSWHAKVEPNEIALVLMSQYGTGECR